MNEQLQQLAGLFGEMEKAYDQIAVLLDFSCDQCPDNCCDSFFLHHTYLEWAYLWEGFKALPKDKQGLYLKRARDYIIKCEAAMPRGDRPVVMFPINDNGRCGIYQHRMMICRLHGVPASMTSPDGGKHKFPGCFRCQELTSGRQNLPTMERTLFFQKMARLEQGFAGSRGLPRIKMTLAEMLVKGPPEL